MKSLYEQDFYLWLQGTIAALKNQTWEKLDLANLIEELEGMTRSERHTIKSRLEVLIIHLLKWKYQSEQRSGSWRGTIREQRRRISDILADSPSLKSYPAQILTQVYEDAREQAAEETALSLTLFPEQSPFTIAEIIDKNFWPDISFPDSYSPKN